MLSECAFCQRLGCTLRPYRALALDRFPGLNPDNSSAPFPAVFLDHGNVPDPTCPFLLVVLWLVLTLITKGATGSPEGRVCSQWRQVFVSARDGLPSTTKERKSGSLSLVSLHIPTFLLLKNWDVL